MLRLTVGRPAICLLEMLVAAPVFSAANLEVASEITMASLSIWASSSSLALSESDSASWRVTSVKATVL